MNAACLWFLARHKNPGNGLRDRRGQVLFIDARQMGCWWTTPGANSRTPRS